MELRKCLWSQNETFNSDGFTFLKKEIVELMEEKNNFSIKWWIGCPETINIKFIVKMTTRNWLKGRADGNRTPESQDFQAQTKIMLFTPRLLKGAVELKRTYSRLKLRSHRPRARGLQ